MQKIIIEDLEVYANHGVYKEEKILGQKFLISLNIVINENNLYIEDNIKSTVHYGIVCEEVYAFLKNNTFDLIEVAAKEVILMLVEKYKTIEELGVEIKKPSAPIALPFKKVSVEVYVKKRIVYISLGGNIGDSNSYFDTAILNLSKVKGILNINESTRYSTRAYGFEEQDDFLNSVIEVETILGPHDLLKELQRIEIELERKREIHWGPRTIDLDIIFYSNLIINDKELNVPHPLMHERDFVLQPLVELNPFFIHPYKNLTTKELLDACVVKYIHEES